MTTICERIFEKLERLMGDLRDIPEAKKSRVPGFMDLNLDRLSPNGSTTLIALSHYYEHPSGDLIADPDMEICIKPHERMAEARSYQDAHMYRCVSEEGEGGASRTTRRELNEFLEQWLANCLAQGHRLT
jgi:uncharacterized protein YqiB (DUF1249 family)